MRKTILFISFLACLAGVAYFLTQTDSGRPSQKPPSLVERKKEAGAPARRITREELRARTRAKFRKPKKKKPSSLAALKRKFLALLNKGSGSSKTIDLPVPLSALEEEAPPPTLPPPIDERARGRQARKNLPLGVALWDKTPVLRDQKGETTLYVMDTGDFVRVFTENPSFGRHKVQPGVDVYLAATSKQFEAAGNRLPDLPGWVDGSRIHIFKPAQAIEFTQKTNPVTLGDETTFSTLAFYERAMKNPDPVVHRVVGPRLIELLSIHEDYVSSWGSLYRDHDSKIRSVTLAALLRRGVGHNREIMEDLIKRLAELTQTHVRGEQEIEVLMILSILKESKHPRVPAALQSFKESWAQTQGEQVNEALLSMLPEEPGEK